VIQPDFVLEFLKIPLDAPADFDQPDQLRELHRHAENDLYHHAEGDADTGGQVP
jgi:hypothetical protein